MRQNRSCEPQTAEAPYGAVARPGTVQPDDVSAGFIGLIGLFSVLVFVLILLLLQAWFFNSRQEVAGTRVVASDDPRTPLGRMLVEHKEQLGSYRWINREAQIRAIPIDRAMQLVAGELAATRKAKTPADRRKP